MNNTGTCATKKTCASSSNRTVFPVCSGERTGSDATVRGRRGAFYHSSHIGGVAQMAGLLPFLFQKNQRVERATGLRGGGHRLRFQSFMARIDLLSPSTFSKVTAASGKSRTIFRFDNSL